MATVETPLGKVQGIEHRGCLAFRGIRFAKAPTGPLRFRPPQSVEPWSGFTTRPSSVPPRRSPP